MADFIGTAGDDTFKGTGQDDVFDMSQGGNDVVLGLGGDDEFDFGGAFTAADKINGGAGNDTLVLDGDYSAGVVFAASTMKAVEEIDLTGGFSYSLTTNNANVAAGQTLTINAGDLSHSDRIVFNGSHETDGNFAITVGLAHAVLTGGAVNDTFTIGERLGSTIQGPAGGDIGVVG